MVPELLKRNGVATRGKVNIRKPENFEKFLLKGKSLTKSKVIQTRKINWTSSNSFKFSKFLSDFRKETTVGIWECITQDNIIVIWEFVGVIQWPSLEEFKKYPQIIKYLQHLMSIKNVNNYHPWVFSRPHCICIVQTNSVVPLTYEYHHMLLSPEIYQHET